MNSEKSYIYYAALRIYIELTQNAKYVSPENNAEKAFYLAEKFVNEAKEKGYYLLSGGKVC